MARPIADSAIRHPLNDILSAEAHIRILRELCLHGGFLSVGSIATKTGLSKSGLRKALEALGRTNAIVDEGSDRTRLYRFNWSHPFANQISALFAAENDRLQRIFDSVRGSGQILGARLASLWIYGSVARREDGIESDVDIGVIADAGVLPEVVENVREYLRVPARDEVFLPNVVGLDFDDIRRLASDQDPWWESCVADAIVMVGRRPEELAAEFLRERANG